jgi:hypothetical protein
LRTSSSQRWATVWTQVDSCAGPARVEAGEDLEQLLQQVLRQVVRLRGEPAPADERVQRTA